jgi:hypothetical protein
MERQDRRALRVRKGMLELRANLEDRELMLYLALLGAMAVLGFLWIPLLSTAMVTFY